MWHNVKCHFYTLAHFFLLLLLLTLPTTHTTCYYQYTKTRYPLFCYYCIYLFIALVYCVYIYKYVKNFSRVFFFVRFCLYYSTDVFTHLLRNVNAGQRYLLRWHFALRFWQQVFCSFCCNYKYTRVHIHTNVIC